MKDEDTHTHLRVSLLGVDLGDGRGVCTIVFLNLGVFSNIFFFFRSVGARICVSM